MTNYPYRWFTNIAALLEKREYATANIFLFALFVGSFRRFLEWTLGGVPEPFPLSFIVTLTGFYWLAFFLITLILRNLVDQPWRVSINVILVGIFLGVFPPILDLLISGPGFEYAYVWSVPSQFRWYLYNPALKIPIGEAIVLWAVIVLTTLYVWHRTRSAWRAVAALLWAYATVLVLGGVVAGAAKYFRLFMGWEPTQQIALVNLLQVLAALAAYLLLQPRLARRLLSRVPGTLPYLALCLAGTWATGAGVSVTTLLYTFLLFILLVMQVGEDGGADREDVRFLSITAGLLLAALTTANSLTLLPLLLVFLVGLIERLGGPAATLLKTASAIGAFAVGITAAAEQAAYGAPRWWISFLPSPADPAAVGPLDGLGLALLAVTASGAFFAFSWRRLDSLGAVPAEPPAYSAFRVLGLIAFVGVARLFLDWVLLGHYPITMLISLLISVSRYFLALFGILMVLQRVAGLPWRTSVNVALRFWWLGIVPPFVDSLVGVAGNIHAPAWAPPGRWSWMLYYPDQGLGAGEAALWWSLILLAAVYAGRVTRSPVKLLGVLALAYVTGALLGIGPLVLAHDVRASFGWPSEHRLVLLAIVNVIASLAAYLALQPPLWRGLLRRIPHALPFLLFGFLGSAFYGGRVSATTVVYSLALVLGGWIALGQNDYFDAEEDSAQGRLRYLDLEDVRFLSVIAWLGLACGAAAHSAATFLGVMAVVTFMLYNYPFYRGKRYFPTNLKIEGIWGFCAFAFGVVAAFEQAAYGAPRWWVSHSPPLAPEFLGPFDPTTIGAMFLAFGGFSLVAVLKDYKDAEADAAAGVHTLYTVAAKRGWRRERVHAVALAACCAAIAGAPFLMALAGKIQWPFTPGGVPAAVVVGRLMWAPPSRTRFQWALISLSIYFLFLIVALTLH